MDGVIDAYFGEDIRILISDPTKVSAAAITAILAELEIEPASISQVDSL
ncbi:MAG: hypothetical protein ACI8QS_001743 [Planctomycetota bacterium]|jgi:hypothetical protein